MTTKDKFLERTFNKVRIRTWLSLLFFVANFLIAHGAAMYWNFGKSPLELIVGSISSLVLILVLSEPA